METKKVSMKAAIEALESRIASMEGGKAQKSNGEGKPWDPTLIHSPLLADVQDAMSRLQKATHDEVVKTPWGDLKIQVVQRPGRNPDTNERIVRDVRIAAISDNFRIVATERQVRLEMRLARGRFDDFVTLVKFQTFPSGTGVYGRYGNEPEPEE